MTPEEARLVGTKCAADPVFFSENVLGTHPWGKQKEIMRSVRDNANTIVATGHGLGKTRTAAETTLWFLLTKPYSYVITTAPTSRQVESILWAEIASLYNNAKVPLGGRLLKTSLTIDDKWFAMGLSTDEPDRFQGFHAEDILLVMDEAPGVDPKIYEAAQGILTSRGAKTLLIGNPTSPSGQFYEYFKNPLWNKFQISCFESPAIKEPEKYRSLTTMKWIEERKAEWGEHSPMYMSRVLGLFPEEGEDTLIPLVWCEAAARKFEKESGRADKTASDRVYMGLDVARYGSNRSVLTVLQNNRVLRQVSVQNKNTVEVVQLVVNEAISVGNKLVQVAVDDVGVGCIAQGTQIITPKGPVKIEEFKEGDMVFSEDMSIERIESIESYNCDILKRGKFSFAPGHFMRYKTRKNNSKWLPASWDYIIKKKEFCLEGATLNSQREKGFILKAYSHRMPNGGRKTTSMEKSIDGGTFAKLLGWYLSEGCLNGTNGIQIVQKGEHVEEIRALVGTLPFSHDEQERDGAVRFRVFSTALNKWVRNNCYIKGARKDFFTKKAPEWIFTNSDYVIKSFLDTFCKGDGYIRRGRAHYVTSSESLLDSIVMLSWMVGRPVSYNIKSEPGSCGIIEGRNLVRTKRCYCIYETSDNGLYVNKDNKEEIEHGMVYKIHITGKSKKFACKFGRAIVWVHNGGVTDRLREMSYPVLAVNGSTKPSDLIHFRALRDEMFWYLRELFRSGELAIPPSDTLMAQLSAIKYKIQEGSRKILIETKDEMKKRGLKSPDDADSLCLAVWASRRFSASSGFRRASSSRREGIGEDMVYY